MTTSKSTANASIKDNVSGLKANVELKSDAVNNGLHVIAEIDNFNPGVDGSYPVFPAAKVAWNCEALVNGSNNSMDVDGSSTPQVFQWTNSGSEPWYLQELSFLIYDPGSMDINDFGSITGTLSNGLLIEFQTNGNLYTFANLTKNTDIEMCFEGQGGVTGDESTGWLDDDDWFSGISKFKPEITLNQNDFIRATVRDNLIDLTELRMAIRKFRKA